jgi:cation:H+ antiporter
MTVQWIILVAGMLAMVLGSDWLVKGSVRLSRLIGVSEFFIAVVVIGIGTSLPELFISIFAGADGNGALAVGNAIGSNVINIFGILGIGALLRPISTDGKNHSLDIAFLWLASVAFLWAIAGGEISRLNGAVLFAIFIAYVIFSHGRNKTDKISNSTESSEHKLIGIFLPLIAGAVVLWLGGNYFMDALAAITKNLGISQALAGIIITAPGTSMPELLVTIIAAIRKKPAIAIGNIIGSNISNICIVAGGAAMLSPLAVPLGLIKFDIWLMLAATGILCLCLLYMKKLSRPLGFAFLAALSAYFYFSVLFD